jgi:hypothetical protein
MHGDEHTDWRFDRADASLNRPVTVRNALGDLDCDLVQACCAGRCRVRRPEIQRGHYLRTDSTTLDGDGAPPMVATTGQSPSGAQPTLKPRDAP